MATRVFQQSRALRDSLAEAHVRALNTGKFDKVYNRLLKTSRMQANLYLNKYGGTYNPKQTQKYLQKMARSQLGSVTDGMGSSTAASHFGVEEYARQNPGRDWVLTWHHGAGGSRPRPEHVAMDGQTTDINHPFDVTPGLGAPGCSCMIELTVAAVAPQIPQRPRRPREPRQPTQPKPQLPEWRDPNMDDVLKNGQINIQSGDLGQSMNDVRLGTVEYQGKTYNVIIKSDVELTEIRAEQFAQYLNDTYGFNLKIPRLAQRVTVDEGEQINQLVSMMAPGDTPIGKGFDYEDIDDFMEIMIDNVAPEQLGNMALFDASIGNVDRHMANYLLENSGDATWPINVIPIDHGLSMSTAQYTDVDLSTIQALAARGESFHVLSGEERSILLRIQEHEDDVRQYWRSLRGGYNDTEIDDFFVRIETFLDGNGWDLGGTVPEF